MDRIRRIRLVLAVIGGAVALSAGMAFAQEYDLGFTLPTAGKSGCMVCHGDRNLIRPVGDGFVSYFVDGAVLDGSAHATILCTGCHTDFSFKAPHGSEQSDWRANARLACKNCHQPQFEAYSRGVHSISVKPGTAEAEAARSPVLASRAATGTGRDATASAPATGSATPTSSTAATRSATASPSAPATPSKPASPSVPATGAPEKPLCGDCHGAHDIGMLTDNPQGQLALHRKGYEVCGRCHEEWWDNYNDYYHGRAFKRGVWDSPACWDCHSWHEVYAVDDRRSGVSETNIIETCAQCHKQGGEKFAEASSDMIHGRDEALGNVWGYAAVMRVLDSVTRFFEGLFD